MKILAYDSSSEHLSIALYEDEKKISEFSSHAGARHSDILVPMIEKLLKKSGVKLSDIGVFAVDIGPGSFTGLRVGIVTAKVLGYVLKKKIVGVCSLEAIAREALGARNGHAAVALDARKSKVYGAVYERRKEKFRVIVKPALFDAKKFGNHPMTLLAKRDALWRAETKPNEEPVSSSIPKASRIAEGAFPLIRQKKFIDPFFLKPLYLHPKDCNVTPPKK